MKPRYRFLLPLAFVCAAFCGVPLRADPAAGLFKKGDRWAVVGDSITQNGTYHTWIYLYYVTRFPELGLEAGNCGISGDSAAGGLRRYDWDIRPKHATIATVMFGMNDVSRGLYTASAPTPEIMARRETALSAYRDNLTELAKRLKADGARLVFVTPSPFDDTVEADAPNNPGINKALASCGDFMRKLATSTGGTVVDLHGPMTELNIKLQKADPKASVIGPDRIHPAAPGHLVMAYHFLKGQGAPGLVSRVEIDARAARATKAENAEVRELARQGEALDFTVLEKSLPFPIPEETRQALDWVPFDRDFNQQLLRVTGLAPGAHTLVVDGEPVGAFDATEFARGLELSTLAGLPQTRQAAAVLELVRKWQKEVAHWDRGVAQVEHFHLKDAPRPITLDAVKPGLEERLAKLQGSDAHMDKYNRSIIERYLKVKPREEESKRQIAELQVRIREAAKPVPHHFRILSGGS